MYNPYGKRKRSALTLIEVVVVIAIVAILVALMIPAIVKVREYSVYCQSVNNLRQIGLATLNCSSTHNSRIPVVSTIGGENEIGQVFVEILPYLDQTTIYTFIQAFRSFQDPDPISIRIQVYLNPLDPNPEITAFNEGPNINYAANAQVFTGMPSLARIPDGASNTILFAEHYQQCGAVTFRYNSQSRWDRIDTPDGGNSASFADGGPAVMDGNNPDDYYPITLNGRSSAVGNATFQVAPLPPDCDPRLPNATSRRGLQTIMADGSFRLFAPGVAPHIFWAAVTPNGNEPAQLD
jgi:prepilin-type N-terminal cleavage/methylation domain-containing protein